MTKMRRPFALRKTAFRLVRAVIEPAEEYLLAAIIYLVVRPAALMLSARNTRALCNAMAHAMVYTTIKARDIVGNVQDGFGYSRNDARQIALEKLFLTLWEFAVHIRVTRDPYWYRRVECTQVNRQALDSLLASGKSFIVAKGHFARDEASCWVFDPGVLPIAITQVIAPIPERHWLNPHLIYNRIHLIAMTRLLHVLHGGDVDVATVGDESASVSKLIGHLKETRCALAMYVDAPWNPTRHRNALVRPFAAARRGSFAVGAARIARATGVPIIFCVPEHIDELHCKITWHDPIWVPAEGGRDIDVATTNLLLDMIEKKIGMAPELYLLSLGEGRRWDAAAREWQGTKPDEVDASLA